MKVDKLNNGKASMNNSDIFAIKKTIIIGRKNKTTAQFNIKFALSFILILF